VQWGRDTFSADLLRADFGVMPLPDTPYTRGKCSYKLLQYAAAGIPLIGSPVGANMGVLSMLGGLGATTTEEWIGAGSAIIEMGDEARAGLGTAMRAGVVAEFSYARWADRWLQALDITDGH
jgi:glycosyltransferase involved in cell wall biosynthesis